MQFKPVGNVSLTADYCTENTIVEFQVTTALNSSVPDFCAAVLDAERRLHLSESEERRLGATRDEPEEQAPLVLVHGGHRAPEHLEREEVRDLVGFLIQ